jgi:dUTP pyrophosphatase
MDKLEVKRLNELALLPTRANPYDAGLDLYALESVPFKPGELVKVKTGIAVNIPKYCVGLIRDRSSVSLKNLKVTAGVIDHGYTGDISVVLTNHSDQYGCIQKGDKVAQLLVMPIYLPHVIEVDFKGDRGEKGFGSSGR